MHLIQVGMFNEYTYFDGVGCGIEVDSVVPERLVAEHGQHGHDGVGQRRVLPLFPLFCALLLRLFVVGEELCEEEGEGAAAFRVVERGLLLLTPDLDNTHGR